MEKLWSETTRQETWLKVEVLAAKAMSAEGLVPKKDLDVIVSKAKDKSGACSRN